MYFLDRVDAGQKLAPSLETYRGNRDAIVLGLPRGGVVLAYEVAQNLSLPLDIVCPRKVGAPFNPELAIGATTETGDSYFDESIIRAYGISAEYIRKQTEAEKNESARRTKAYRPGRRPLSLEGKIAIIVDDGLATGATMKAAIKSVKSLHAKKIVIAVPVAPKSTVAEIEELADEVICLSTPIGFMAVGQFYEDFSATTDEEVIDLMSKAKIIP